MILPKNGDEMTILDILYLLKEKQKNIMLSANGSDDVILTKVNDGHDGTYKVRSDFYMYILEKFDSRFNKC
jgi:hypothetical protein